MKRSPAALLLLAAWTTSLAALGLFIERRLDIGSDLRLFLPAANTTEQRLLLDAIRKNQAGEKPLMVLDPGAAAQITGPAAVDGIGPTERLEDYWKEFDANRRRHAAWAA